MCLQIRLLSVFVAVLIGHIVVSAGRIICICPKGIHMRGGAVGGCFFICSLLALSLSVSKYTYFWLICVSSDLFVLRLDLRKHWFTQAQSIHCLYNIFSVVPFLFLFSVVPFTLSPIRTVFYTVHASGHISAFLCGDTIGFQAVSILCYIYLKSKILFVHLFLVFGFCGWSDRRHYKLAN